MAPIQVGATWSQIGSSIPVEDRAAQRSAQQQDHPRDGPPSVQIVSPARASMDLGVR